MTITKEQQAAMLEAAEARITELEAALAGRTVSCVCGNRKDEWVRCLEWAAKGGGRWEKARWFFIDELIKGIKSGTLKPWEGK